MNYRKEYELHTERIIPDNFDVHHIDHKRTNNHISNLVAIPMSLHRAYHLAYRQIDVPLFKIKKEDFKHADWNRANSVNAFYEVKLIEVNNAITAIQSLNEMIFEIWVFKMYRDYLLHKNDFFDCESYAGVKKYIQPPHCDILISKHLNNGYE